MQEAITTHGGHAFRVVGDAFCIAFSDATSAILSAVDAQRALSAQSWDDAPIRVRMGLHSGAVEDAEDEIFRGPTLARAARLMAAAHGGQMLVTAATIALLDRTAPRGVPSTIWETTSCARPERLYQLMVAGLRSKFPPIRTQEAMRTNLPPPCSGLETAPGQQMTSNLQLPSACCARSADATHHELTPERISLFKVPVGCEAVAGLGCGVRAKPILQALARQPAVAHAWLNRNGTIVAVLREEGIGPEVRGEQVRSILAEHGLAVRELVGVARKSTLRDFSSGTGWYRGDALDRLSEQEAAIVAARLVHRVTAKVPLSDAVINAVMVCVVTCNHPAVRVLNCVRRNFR